MTLFELGLLIVLAATVAGLAALTLGGPREGPLAHNGHSNLSTTWGRDDPQ